MSPVHLRSRAARTGRVGDGDRRHRGDRVGVVVDIVRVGSEEIESSYRNNVAAALARVIGPLTPPVPTGMCRTLTASPRLLENGRSSVVRVTARNRLGRPLAGLPVRARGAGVRTEATTDARGIARFAMSPTRGRSGGLLREPQRGRSDGAALPDAARRPGGARDEQVTG